MTAFELPYQDGSPLEIVDFNVDLVLSPPEIKERLITAVDPYIVNQTGTLKINYIDAPTEEGHLNIYICRFKTGKCRLHIFGRIKGQEFRTEREINDYSNNSLDIINRQIKYVLVNSRNILRTYYLNSNLKSLENHLMAFLIPLK